MFVLEEIDKVTDFSKKFPQVQCKNEAKNFEVQFIYFIQIKHFYDWFRCNECLQEILSVYREGREGKKFCILR